jgi:hypothetical protein
MVASFSCSFVVGRRRNGEKPTTKYPEKDEPHEPDS